jgi:cell wall-associated NlpC family hydrolase
VPVRLLQNAVGTTVDGGFGPHTKAAVEAAQRRLKLAVTGVVTVPTWAALGLTGTPLCAAPQTAAGGSTPPHPNDSKQQAAVRAEVARLAQALPKAAGTTSDPLAAHLLAFAKAQTGKPYKWGAVGPKAYDCSGLVLAALQSVGVTMPRVAADQYTVGVKVPLDHAEQGDLVFFASDVTQPATIYHVGIYAGAGKVVDAPYTGAYVGVRSLWTQDLLPVVVRPTAWVQLPVKEGASGWTVTQLQAALDRGGAKLTVDGADGTQTTAALEAWQKAHKLTANGVADVATWLSF